MNFEELITFALYTVAFVTTVGFVLLVVTAIVLKVWAAREGQAYDRERKSWDELAERRYPRPVEKKQAS